jgi:hypothetical protein
VSPSLEEFTRRCRQPGLAIVVSDLLDPKGYEKGLSALLYRKFDLVLLQILDEAELAPPNTGELRLQDVETSEREKISVDASVLKLYHSQLLRFFRGIEEFCLARGIEYLRISTRVPFEDLILKYLRQGLHLH